jgi:hypothetical protein
MSVFDIHPIEELTVFNGLFHKNFELHFLFMLYEN